MSRKLVLAPLEASGERFWTGKTVVLTDEATGGAAEVFAAALHDRAQASTVGETTVGMAIVQRMVPTESGGTLFMTVARYVSPSGTSLAGKGMTPDDRVIVFADQSKPAAGIGGRPDSRPRSRDRARRGSGTPGRVDQAALAVGAFRRKVSPAAVFFALLSLVLGIASSRALTRPAGTATTPAEAPSRPRLRVSPPGAHGEAARRRPPGRDAARPRVSPASSAPPSSAASAGPARVAILIDDLGNDRAAVDRISRWTWPVSTAVLPALPGSVETARELERSGKEVLLHLPMEPKGFPAVRPGPGVVLLSQSDEAIAATLERDLDSVPGAVGVNNHMGSAATADARVMRAVVAVLSRRGLFFLDSRTTDATVARDVAREANVRSASRRVFLDDVATESAVEASLQGLFARARSEGSAIAIGHPHPATLAVLDRELPRLAEHGVRLVRISELVE